MSRYGREVILGVSGGISAYKSCELLRRLQDIGLDLTVIPTQNALRFVGQATWEALSGKKALTDLWAETELVSHIKLAKKSRALIVAPATANFIAKVASGIADDLLTTVFLASDAPKILVPAMHPEMWVNPVTVANVEKLRNFGVLVVEPDIGRMTGEDIGVGRYPEVPRLVDEISKHLDLNSDYSGKRVVVSAGGTREYIDPVRYIGNRSSGKQGIAVAQAALNRGAEVVLIGANIEVSPQKGLKFISANTADEMFTELLREVKNSDLLVMAAAVADAKPEKKSDTKIKKSEFRTIDLVENRDILAELASCKAVANVMIGFAAETSGDITKEATRKLIDKQLDFIYVNDVANGEIFGSDKTSGSIVSKEGHIEEIVDWDKVTLAHLLLDKALDKLG